MGNRKTHSVEEKLAYILKLADHEDFGKAQTDRAKLFADQAESWRGTSQAVKSDVVQVFAAVTTGLGMETKRIDEKNERFRRLDEAVKNGSLSETQTIELAKATKILVNLTSPVIQVASTTKTTPITLEQVTQVVVDICKARGLIK